jgi:HEAT repeat protein
MTSEEQENVKSPYLLLAGVIAAGILVNTALYLYTRSDSLSAQATEQVVAPVAPTEPEVLSVSHEAEPVIELSESVKLIIEKLNDRDVSRFHTLKSIPDHDAINPEIIPVLLPLAVDQEEKVAHQAMQMLLKLKPPPEQLLPILLRSYKANNEYVSYLKGFAALSGNVISQLRSIVENKESKRLAALRLLVQHDKSPYTARILSNQIRGECPKDLMMIRAAMTMLGNLGEAAEKEVPTVIWALDKGCDLSVRRGAVSTLRKIGPAASAAIPKLTALLPSSKSYQRYSIVRTLVAIGGMNGEAIRSLEILLQDPDISVRRVTLNWILDHAEDCKPLTPNIEQLAKNDPERKIRSLAGNISRVLRELPS